MRKSGPKYTIGYSHCRFVLVEWCRHCGDINAEACPICNGLGSTITADGKAIISLLQERAIQELSTGA